MSADAINNNLDFPLDGEGNVAPNAGVTQGRQTLRKNQALSRENQALSDQIQREFYKKYLTQSDSDLAKTTGSAEFKREYDKTTGEILRSNPQLDEVSTEAAALGTLSSNLSQKSRIDRSFVNSRLSQYKRQLYNKFKSQYKDKKDLNKAVEEEYNKSRLTFQNQIAKRDPTLTKAEVQELADRALVEDLNLGGAVSALRDAELRKKVANLVKEKAKKALLEVSQKAIKYTFNSIFYPLGSILAWLFGFKIVRVVIMLVMCCCCCYMISVVTILAKGPTEFLIQAVTASPNLLECAGTSGDTGKLKCLVEQKAEQYINSDPATEL